MDVLKKLVEKSLERMNATKSTFKGIDRVYFSTNIFETHENYFLRSVCGEGSELSDGDNFFRKI